MGQDREEFNLEEVTVNQGDYGGAAVKPTTFGGDLPLVLTSPRPRGHQDDGGAVKDSKQLARWAPGVMRMIAVDLQRDVRGGHEKMK